MTWEYRVMRHTCPDPELDEVEDWYEIHEVYSNPGCGHTVYAIAAQGLSVEELQRDLIMMLAATLKPVIDVE